MNILKLRIFSNGLYDSWANDIMLNDLKNIGDLYENKNKNTT